MGLSCELAAKDALDALAKSSSSESGGIPVAGHVLVYRGGAGAGGGRSQWTGVGLLLGGLEYGDGAGSRLKKGGQEAGRGSAACLCCQVAASASKRAGLVGLAAVLAVVMVLTALRRRSSCFLRMSLHFNWATLMRQGGIFSAN